MLLASQASLTLKVRWPDRLLKIMNFGPSDLQNKAA
jgi:hypothetical protein